MLRSGLIGAWLVNEGGGSSLENALRETRDPITGATWAPGLDGPSLNFTGGATDHVDLGALNPGAAGATASLWFKIPAGNTTGGGLLSQYDNTTSGSSFMLWQRNGFNVFDVYSSGVAGSQSVNTSRRHQRRQVAPPPRRVGQRSRSVPRLHRRREANHRRLQQPLHDADDA
jgi:hypothetical protein